MAESMVTASRIPRPMNSPTLYDVDASTSTPLLALAAASVFQLFLCVTDSLDRGILDKTLAAAEGDHSIDHVF